MWTAWTESDTRNNQARSQDMQISKAEQRMERLTDLLVDGTIDKTAYEARKRTLALELARVREEQRETQNEHLNPNDMAKFLELMKSLAGLYILAEPTERRLMVRNAFSNLSVQGKNVELEPSDWLVEVQRATAAPVGDPCRHTNRTFKKAMKLVEPDDKDWDFREIPAQW